MATESEKEEWYENVQYLQENNWPIRKYFFAILESEDNIHVTGMTIKGDFTPKYLVEEIGFMIGAAYIDEHTKPYYIEVLKRHGYIEWILNRRYLS